RALHSFPPRRSSDLSALYLGLYLVVYALLISIVRFAVGKKRAQHPLFNHARTGIRYLFGLGALLVIMAQFGAAPELLKSMARAEIEEHTSELPSREN